MKEVRKYVLVFIILALVSFALPAAINLCLTVAYQGDIRILRGLSKVMYPLAEVVQNIGAAIWLRCLAKKDGSGALLWLFFGLVGGLLAVGVYYLIRLNDEKSGQVDTPNGESTRSAHGSVP